MRRGNSRATVVCQTDHARHFIRWCHDREIKDPSWIFAGLAHAVGAIHAVGA